MPTSLNHRATQPHNGGSARADWGVGAFHPGLQSATQSPVPESATDAERIANRLHHLLQALPGGVVVLDRDGYVEQCNPAARHVIGCELTGTRWRDVVHRVVEPRPDDDCDVSLANGRRVNITTCSLGVEPGQILLINDVTESRELKDKVANIRRLSEMGTMMAAIAHQIRTPLSTALLYATAADADASMRSKLVERLQHLDALVNDMLCFARQGSLYVEPIAAGDLVAGFAALLSAEELPTSIEFDGPAWDQTSILGNQDALNSVFQNLVNNAREAQVQDELIIELDASVRDNVWIRVADNGPGIPPSMRERVFEPFVSTSAQGTGLGLPVARRVIESHGGTLKLDAEAEAGAAFIIELPVAAAITPTADDTPSLVSQPGE